MEEYDYKGQLIVVHTPTDVTYFLYGEEGEPYANRAESKEDAERKIDAFYEENGGFYDCEGDLYQY